MSVQNSLYSRPMWLAFSLVLFSAFPSSSHSSPSKGTFLQITDFHIDDKYDRDGSRENNCHLSAGDGDNKTPKQKLGPFGDRSCDSPVLLMNFMLDEAKRTLPEPDFIIWTGDSASHDNYDPERMVRTIGTATDAVKERFPQTLVIPVMGNHDLAPGNIFPDDPKELSTYGRIFDIWKEWIGPEAKDTFVRGGYYRFRSPVDGSVYLVLNTNIYYWLNKDLDKFLEPEDPTGQFAFLEKELGRAAANDSFVHILGHVPPGAYEYSFVGKRYEGEMPPKYNRRLVGLIQRYAGHIRWMLFGHFHTDTFRMVKDALGKPVQTIFISPAVTPNWGSNNPAFRLYDYNVSSLELEDIKTYYVDLDSLNKEQHVQTQLEYSMRDSYGLNAFGPVEMQGLLERMGKNESLFLDYVRFNKVMYNPAHPNDSIRIEHLCIMEFVDLDLLKECISTATSGGRRAGMVLIPLFISSFLLTVLLHYIPKLTFL